jgi:hypothetical protein
MVPMTGQLRTSIDVAATPERAWQVLTDVAAYPLWAPALTGAAGAFADGGRVTFRFPPGFLLLRSTVPARVLEVIPCRRLRFGLRFARLGMPGLLDTEHTLTIDPQDDGVRLWLEIRFRGLLLPIMRRKLNRDRVPTFGTLPAALKARIEDVPATRPG